MWIWDGDWGFAQLNPQKISLKLYKKSFFSFFLFFKFYLILIYLIC